MWLLQLYAARSIRERAGHLSTKREMAQLRLDELFSAVEAHPRYLVEWQDGIPAHQSLRVRATEELPSIRSEVFAMLGGKELVVDFDAEGRVAAIEIV